MEKETTRGAVRAQREEEHRAPLGTHSQERVSERARVYWSSDFRRDHREPQDG